MSLLFESETDFNDYLDRNLYTDNLRQTEDIGVVNTTLMTNLKYR